MGGRDRKLQGASIRVIAGTQVTKTKSLRNTFIISFWFLLLFFSFLFFYGKYLGVGFGFGSPRAGAGMAPSLVSTTVWGV